MHAIEGTELIKIFGFLGLYLLIVGLIFLGFGYLIAYLLRKCFKCLLPYDLITLTMFTAPAIVIIFFFIDSFSH